MYRSYSVNNMPQPIRYYDRGAGAEHSVKEKSDVHIDNTASVTAADARSEPCPGEVQEAEQNLEQNCPVKNCAVANCPARGIQPSPPNNNGGLLAGLNLKNDDLILLAVAFILLMDGCDDKLLIAALGLVFFSDYFGFGNT